jgi:hypothetical protein
VPADLVCFGGGAHGISSLENVGSIVPAGGQARIAGWRRAGPRSRDRGPGGYWGAVSTAARTSPVREILTQNQAVLHR